MKFVRDPVSWTRNVAMTCYLVLKISNRVVKVSSVLSWVGFCVWSCLPDDFSLTSLQNDVFKIRVLPL